MNWASEGRRRWTALLVVVLVAACGGGGGGGGGETGGPDPALPPDATGFLPGGAAVKDLQVTLRGTRGLGRIVLVREDGSFSASRSKLEGPYVVNAQPFDETTGTMLDSYAWSADGQGVSVNALSTLQLAVLARQDPRAVYTSLSQWHGVSFDAARVAAAEDEVAAYLQQYLGVTVPAGVRGFATRSWVTGSGDAFETTIAAVLAAALARGEDLGTLAARLGRRTAACERQALPVTVGGVARRFCPATLARGADPDDASRTLHRIDADEDGVLELRVQAGVVVSIVHSLPDGRTFGCSGAACAGAVLQGGSRVALQLALPAQDGGGGSTRFDGTLALAAATGTVRTPAECRSNRVAVAGADALPAQAECAATDDFGQGATFSYQRGGSALRGVDFLLTGSARLLSVSLDGATVRSIVMSEFDFAAGLSRYYACRGEACAGVQAGAAEDDPLDVGWQVRPLALAATRLERLRDDGSLDAADTRVLDASLRVIIDPFAVQNIPTDCTGLATIAVTVERDTLSYGICPPPGDPSAAAIYDEPDGLTRTVLARSANFESVAVTIDAADRVLRAALDTNNGQRFGCGRSAGGEPACSGIRLSARGADGTRTLAFASTRMVERVYGDFPDPGRSARLSGAVAIIVP